MFKTPIIPKLIKRVNIISVKKTLVGFSQKKEYKSRFRNNHRPKCKGKEKPN